jgi:hypothetical protein
MKKKFRKNWIIYPKFQLQLVVANLVVMLIVLGLTYLFINQSYENLLNEGVSAQLDAEHPYFGFVKYQSGIVYSYLGLSFLVAFLLSTIASIYISHKVAGPIVRLRGHFKKISEGAPVEKVAFRRGDFFSDLPGEINKAFDKVKNVKE